MVTLPGFGKKDTPTSWGHGFPDLVGMLVNVIEKHSPNKRVTLVAHDWGACLAYMLQKSHPKLVKRMAIIDIGRTLSTKSSETLCSMSFQMFLGLCFLVGEPAGGTVMRSMFGKFIKHRNINELKPQMNYP